MTPVIRTPYLITSRSFPESQELLGPELNKSYFEVASAVNARVIGINDTFQLVTGERWFSTDPNDAQKKRQSYRKVFPFTSTIAPGATFIITHGIVGVTSYTYIGGTVITDVPDNRPLPFADATGQENIDITVTATQIIIVNGDGTGTASILSGIVVLEYLLN